MWILIVLCVLRGDMHQIQEVQPMSSQMQCERLRDSRHTLDQAKRKYGRTAFLVCAEVKHNRRAVIRGHKTWDEWEIIPLREQ